MSSLYLFRHGQAGSRDRYDALSELGHQQTMRLGRYLAGQRMRFTALYSGELQRQRETARRIVEALEEAGLDVPEPIVDKRWNEFDLDAVGRQARSLLTLVLVVPSEGVEVTQVVDGAVVMGPAMVLAAVISCDRAGADGGPKPQRDRCGVIGASRARDRGTL